MNLAILQSILGWCAVINVGILLAWALFFMLAHDLMYRLHGRLFKLSMETFDALHYGSMAFFKLTIIVFNITPYIALHLAGRP